MTFDAVIVGSGPAGAVAALALRQLAPMASIAIFSRRDPGNWRHGEVLAPGARPILESLGCWTAFLECGFLESYGTRAAWGSPECQDNEFLFSLRGNGWRLDRELFDAMLLRAAGARDITILDDFAFLDSSGSSSERWRLTGRGFECEARFVIDASGRTAAFAMRQGARRTADDRLAGAAMFFDSGDNDDVMVESTDCGWWYSTSLPGGTMVVAFMTDVDLLREMQLHDVAGWNRVLACSTHTRARLAGAIPKRGPAVATAHTQHVSPMGGNGWVTAGDASMSFDPLSSQGILKALRSGKMAAFVAADFLQRRIDSHSKYEAIAMAELDEYRKTKAMYYGLEQRWAENPFWKRRREC